MTPDRSEALTWWRGMSKEEKQEKINEFARDKSFEFINTSTSWIFKLWQDNLIVTSMVADLANTRDKEFTKQLVTAHEGGYNENKENGLL